MPLPGKAVSFFPYATAYDADRQLIVGYRYDGVYELAGEPRKWSKRAPRALLDYHNALAYDRRGKSFIAFGSNRNSNDVIVYQPETGMHRKMPTPGARPPKTQHAPMAYHSGAGKTVALVDSPYGNRPKPEQVVMPQVCQTWLYDLPGDAWSRLESADLPFACGMNYNLVYDPADDVLLLVAQPLGSAVSVWMLRLAPAEHG
jgi:hypothetical protein